MKVQRAADPLTTEFEPISTYEAIGYWCRRISDNAAYGWLYKNFDSPSTDVNRLAETKLMLERVSMLVDQLAEDQR